MHKKCILQDITGLSISQTSASLKFTVLNPKGRIWTMVAGGGASVIYADTVSIATILIQIPSLVS